MLKCDSKPLEAEKMLSNLGCNVLDSKGPVMGPTYMWRSFKQVFGSMAATVGSIAFKTTTDCTYCMLSHIISWYLTKESVYLRLIKLIIGTKFQLSEIQIESMLGQLTL